MPNSPLSFNWHSIPFAIDDATLCLGTPVRAQAEHDGDEDDEGSEDRQPERERDLKVGPNNPEKGDSSLTRFQKFFKATVLKAENTSFPGGSGPTYFGVQ